MYRPEASEQKCYGDHSCRRACNERLCARVRVRACTRVHGGGGGGVGGGDGGGGRRGHRVRKGAAGHKGGGSEQGEGAGGLASTASILRGSAGLVGWA